VTTLSDFYSDLTTPAQIRAGRFEGALTVLKLAIDKRGGTMSALIRASRNSNREDENPQ